MENKTLIVKFKCPCDGCDGTEVEEVLANVIQYSTVDVLATWDKPGESPAIDYGDIAYNGDNASVEYFCCVTCSKSLKQDNGGDVETTDQLFVWLSERDMLVEHVEQVS